MGHNPARDAHSMSAHTSCRLAPMGMGHYNSPAPANSSCPRAPGLSGATGHGPRRGAVPGQAAVPREGNAAQPVQQAPGSGSLSTPSCKDRRHCKSPGCVQGSSHTSKGRRAGKLCRGPRTPSAQLQEAGKKKKRGLPLFMPQNPISVTACPAVPLHQGAVGSASIPWHLILTPSHCSNQLGTGQLLAPEERCHDTS